MKNHTIGDNQSKNTSFHNNIFCPINTTIGVLAGKWKLPILWQLSNGTKRFGELKRAIPGITPAMLSNQLQELISDGIVQRQEFGEVPPRTEYSLSETGLSLLPVITAMEKWGIVYIKEHKKAIHGECLWSAIDNTVVTH